MQKSGKSNSPFRYPGGKFYARKLILSQIPPHYYYCEPFCGGGSIFFAKPLVEQSILNDADAELINCYIQIRDHAEELIAQLSGLPASKELHKYFKNEFQPKDDLERAFRFYYLNRTSYSGIMKKENCYWGYGDKYSMRPENWPAHLRTVSDKIQEVHFTNKDFQIILESVSRDFFLFIDPPYFNADQDKFYTCSFTREDHYRLATVLAALNERGVKFLLTYDDSAEVRELYGWCQLTNKTWNYTINRTDDQKAKMKLADGHKGSRSLGRELFISNYT